MVVEKNPDRKKIFKETVKERIEDPTGRLTRLLKYMGGEPRELIKPCVQQPTHLGYRNAKMLLEKQYGNPHIVYASYRKEIKNWPPKINGDAKSYLEFFVF